MKYDTILRLPDVVARTGLSVSTIRRREMDDPDFPKRVRLGPNCVGWRESEVRSWIESRERLVPEPS